MASPRPNLLLIMADEMRWDAMGCAGHPVVRTPHLDALARAGSRFLRAYSAAPVCSPARASMFTGRYPHVHGVTQNSFGANQGEVFLPSVLKHYGYDTAIAGKLHFEPRRRNFGFDAFWSEHTAGPDPQDGFKAHLKRKYGENRLFAMTKSSCPWPDDPLGRLIGRYKYPLEDFQTRWITDRSIEWLRTRNENASWFLFTSYVKPHQPYVEPEPYFSMYDPATIPVPPLPPDAARIREAQPLASQKKKYVDSEPMMRALCALYYGAITHVDHEVGRLLTELERLGLSNDTLVVFTSDHGNMLGDRGRWFKGIMYEGSIRVPLILRDPRRPRDGHVVNEVVDGTDLFPSILEALGLPIPERVQGRSWVGLLNGGRRPWRNRCFAEFRGSMLLDDKWKFIEVDRPNEKQCELYNLNEDPIEQHDLAHDPSHHDRVRYYAAEMVAHRAIKPEPIEIPGMSTRNHARQRMSAPARSFKSDPNAPVPDEAAAFDEVTRWAADFADSGALDLVENLVATLGTRNLLLSRWQAYLQMALLQQIEARRPFSLVRLGDGEGSVLFWGSRRADYPALSQYCMQSIWRAMFGNAPANDALWSRLYEGIAGAALNASFLGVPTPRLVNHFVETVAQANEGTVKIRGYAAGLGVWDWLIRHAVDRVRTDLSIVKSLVQRTIALFFDELVRRAGNVSVVSCYGGLLPKLHAHCQVADGESFEIPPQASNVGATPGELHFPDAFEKIDAELRAKPRRGELFFVGAGLLGKLYCESIRQAGGMAIDVGSLMDVWMGIGVRHYQNEAFVEKHRLR